ncbi:hypothetical protein R6Q59_020062 [Mikania micrantha]
MNVNLVLYYTFQGVTLTSYLFGYESVNMLYYLAAIQIDFIGDIFVTWDPKITIQPTDEGLEDADEELQDEDDTQEDGDTEDSEVLLLTVNLKMSSYSLNHLNNITPAFIKDFLMNLWSPRLTFNGSLSL